MDASDRLEFQPVEAAGHHIHCYLDRHYPWRESRCTSIICAIDGAGLVPCHLPPPPLQPSHRTELPALDPPLHPFTAGAIRGRWLAPRSRRSYHLATRRRVSASIQSQALNALVFLYESVLEQPLGQIAGLSRVQRSRAFARPDCPGGPAVESDFTSAYPLRRPQ